MSETGEAWLNEILQHLPAGKSLNILDVGCGTGMFSLMLSKLGHTTTGIDLTNHMILHAKELAKKQHSSARFFCMDAERPDFPDETFDVVLTRNPPGRFRTRSRLIRSGSVSSKKAASS